MWFLTTAFPVAACTFWGNLQRYKLSDLREVAFPKVTVVIVNWNGEQFIERCLAALLVQVVLPYEIILVDNASSDASLDIVRKFPSVQLFVQSDNLGFARGNNLAIAAASRESEWIALLNPDAFVEPRWLVSLLETANAHPDVDIFGSKLVNAADPAVLDGAGDAYHISGMVWRIGHGVRDASKSEHPREVFSPCAAAALYRRTALLEVGGFDEDFFCYIEDVDLCFRLRLAGYHCLYVPISVAHHVGSGTTGGRRSDFASYHGHRNLVWTYVKDMPGVLFWLFLPLHVALNLITIVWFCVHGQRKMIFKAKADAVAGLPAMWRKRRLIQQSRTVSIFKIWKYLSKVWIPFRIKDINKS